MLRFIVVAMVALGGGSISLLLGEWTSFRLTLAGLGLIATLGLNLATWKQYQRITRLIERLPEEKT
jgi:hypothetical protein